MHASRFCRIAVCFAIWGCSLIAGAANEREWNASWITHPAIPLREPVVLHFRRSFHLDARPAHFIVHVSADNRLVLCVNGRRAGDGPARGALAHWRYETFDLADSLQAGENLVA